MKNRKSGHNYEERRNPAKPGSGNESPKKYRDFNIKNLRVRERTHTGGTQVCIMTSKRSSPKTWSEPVVVQRYVFNEVRKLAVVSV